MDINAITTLVNESLFLLIVFGLFFGLALFKGKYTLINTLFGLYLALLITIKFPYFELFLAGGNKTNNAIIMVVLFLFFTGLGTYIMRRHIPGDDYEPVFHDLMKKLVLALSATVLVMAYSYHVLPVTDLITPGSPINALFAPQENFFWWLIAPLVALLFI